LTEINHYGAFTISNQAKHNNTWNERTP